MIRLSFCLLLFLAAISTASAIEKRHPSEDLISSAESGNLKSQTQLCVCYSNRLPKLNGANCEGRHYELAKKWCTVAANRGDAQSQWEIGNMYEHGFGITQDYAEAYFWYSLSRKNTRGDVSSGTEHYIISVANHLTHSQIRDVQNRVAHWEPKTEQKAKK